MGQYKDQMRKTSTKADQCKLCTVQALEGSDFCPAHGGHQGHQAHLEEQRRIYRIAKYQERIGSLVEHPQSRSFREEIAQLRTLLEIIWNSCEDKDALLLKTPQIVQVTDKIMSALISVEKLDRDVGRTKTEEQVNEFLDVVADILATHIEDTQLLAAIAEDLTAAMKGDHEII
jgi:hypothetical protein